jgi:hypothetical protein
MDSKDRLEEIWSEFVNHLLPWEKTMNLFNEGWEVQVLFWRAA